MVQSIIRAIVNISNATVINLVTHSDTDRQTENLLSEREKSYSN